MSQERWRDKSRKRERPLAVAAVIVIFVAWIIGAFRADADLKPFLKQALPQAEHFELVSAGTYAARASGPDADLLGYVTTGKAQGYGGDLTVMVALSPGGTVAGLSVVEQRETAAFFRKVRNNGMLEAFEGKHYADSFIPGKDLDTVTGATYSVSALAEAVKNASRKIAVKNLGFPETAEDFPVLHLGLAEAVLAGLFLFGIAARMRRFRYKRTARWISMLAGLIFLGFVFNKPLTIVDINRALLGFWPQWQTHFYWYILLFGIVFIYIAGNKNPYCEWFCPFGAAQECLGTAGGAKLRIPEPVHDLGRWLQRGLALTAIVIALLHRNPGISSYEVFGAFFRLIGSDFLFVLLGVVLVFSLFIRRPWCSYLCPLRPVTDFIRLMRNWALEIHRKVRHRFS